LSPSTDKLPHDQSWGRFIKIQYLYTLNINYIIDNRKNKIHIFKIIESENQYTDKLFQNDNSNNNKYCILIDPYIPSTFFAIKDLTLLNLLFTSNIDMEYDSQIYHINLENTIDKMNTYTYHIEIKKTYVKILEIIIWKFYAVDNHNEKNLLFEMIKEL
jgi:hypothetical protein